MSQYPSMPPPGTYVPPYQNENSPSSQGYGAQQQHQGHQQPQSATTYQSSAPGHGQPSQVPKGTAGTFGQMMNQAVTTSKPMLNKLSKTISSKLGNKASATGTPQHLQSYQSYQQHYSQHMQHQTQSPIQPQSQTFNPHTQQTLQQQKPQIPSAYPSQQSPYQQTISGNGYNNHLTAPATPQTPYGQPTPPPPQTSQSSYNGAQYSQETNTLVEQQGQPHQGQYHQSQTGQASQGQLQQQPLQAQYIGQQMGVAGGSLHYTHASNPQSPHMSSPLPHSAPPQQAQWQGTLTGSEQSVTSPYQQQSQSYFPSTIQSQSPGNSQQWSSMPPAIAAGQNQHAISPASISPPPPPLQSKPAALPGGSPHQSQSSTPAPQSTAFESPAEFIAELPADLGSLTIAEAKPADHPPVPIYGQHSLYRAYQSSPAPPGPSSPGFTIARRAVSVSSVPCTDPWRFADPLTELPTREFYVIADLLFEALDRKFEPQNTGMLEASKVLRSWIDLSDDATQLFSHNSYNAFARLWTLQGIPHVMVPCQSSLTPIWNFNHNSHARELKISNMSLLAPTHATYMPALNRAGWYKFFFLEMLHGPDNINKMMSALCSETYKPGVLHHPDLSQRDKVEAPELQSRVAEIQAAAINQVCEETKAAIQSC